MHSMKIKYGHIITLIIHFYLYTFISCSIRSMKKISDDGDYFAILDSGIYIYNFEKSTQINITIFNESIFETNDDYNQIIISKNQDDISNEIKIGALINHHLYIYTYDDSNNKLEYLLIEQLKDSRHLTHSFQVKINNASIIIVYLVASEYSVRPDKIQSLSYQNYLDIKPNEPNIDIYFEEKYLYNSYLFCQIDEYDSLIKCVYEDRYCRLYFLNLKKIGDSDNSQKIKIYEPFFCQLFQYRFSNITYSSNLETIFVCANRFNEIKCYYSNKEELIFHEITHNGFEKDCNPLTTYFKQETSEFALSCKKLSTEYLYFFNDTDMSKIYCINVSNNFTDKNNFSKINNKINICDNLEKLLDSSYLRNNIMSDISDIEFFIQCEDSKIQFISIYKQNNAFYKNNSIINLNKCEDELRYYYNISNESDIYILKIEHEIKGMLIPIIEYEVYYLNNETMKKLNLSLCNNTKIDILIPVNINDAIDKHNPKSSYYNDICTKAKSDYDTDIIIDDRRNEFIDKKLMLCEDDCQFINYDNINKKVNCSCEVKTFMSFINEIKIDKNKLFKNFRDINYITNIHVIKCYKLVFLLNNIKLNFGFYIFCFITFTLFICIILFYVKFYSLLIQEIDEIISALKYKNSQNNIIQKNTKIKKAKNKKKLIDEISVKSKKSRALTENSKKKKKKKSKTKDKKLVSEISLNLNSLNVPSKKKAKKVKIFDKSEVNTALTKSNINLNMEQIDNILKYNEFELNSLSYKDALKEDNRSCTQYYFSFLRKNHLIFFSFYPIKDYNSQIIKIFLFFSFFHQILLLMHYFLQIKQCIKYI